jgi:hypothetical protein
MIIAGNENVQDTKTHGDGYTKLFLVLHVQVPEHSPRKKREDEIGGSRVSLMNVSIRHSQPYGTDLPPMKYKTPR